MNIKANFDSFCVAAVFPDMKVVSGIAINDGKVQFSLMHKSDAYSDALIECLMPVLACDTSFNVNQTTDPQQDHWIDIPSWKAIEGTTATIIKLESVSAIEGQPFHLTPDQQHQLNTLIEEWAEEHFKDECEQQATYVAEDMAEEIYG